MRLTKQMREIDPILRRNGYKHIRSNGSHYIYVDNKGNTISVNKDLNKMVKARLIKEYHLKE